MWLARQMKPETPTADADLGVTTISGEQAGVVTRGEVRQLPVYGPGGYVWLPESGKKVLVIKGGPGGEEQCVAGARQDEAPKGMRPGEIFLRGPAGTSVYLKADGTMEIQGKTMALKVKDAAVMLEEGAVDIQGALTVNGVPYRRCEC